MPKPADDLHADPLLHTAPTLEGFKVLEPAVLYAKVGQGGMGAVYRGRHFSLECDVAVKVLKPDLAGDEQFVARFEREARLAARIKNDNVVQVLDVRTVNGIHYLVMEFVRGETARERVMRKGPLAEQEALAIVLGVARGLRAAHDDGIVHRDIKPDNVLIGSDGAVKLADLGLAKQKRQGGAEQSMTMLSSAVMGTPQYMPPEQWKSADVKPSADVWALGAVLWYLLAGRSAIRNGELLEIADTIRDHDFPDLAAARSGLRPEVVALVAKCTRRNPAERFADARELLAALKPLVGERDEVLADAATGTGASRMSTVTPPPRSTLAKIKLQVASQAGTEAHSGPKPKSEQPTMPQAVRPARRGFAALVGALLFAALLLGGGYGYAAGWFDGRPIGPPEAPPDAPPQPNRGLVSAEQGERARAALARGTALLPQAGRLAEAIAAFEEALANDGGLDEAARKLALGRAFQAKSLDDGGDPDAAWAAVQQGLARLRDEAGDQPARAECTRVAQALGRKLQQRLLGGLSLAAPAADAVLGERTVRFEGRMVAPKFRTLRGVLASADAADRPFPRGEAMEVAVVDGRFAMALEAGGDGAFVLRLEAEDEYGLCSELPARRFVVDTQAPELQLAAPEELALVPAKVAVVGTVRDGSLRELTIDKTRVEVAADGTFRTEVTLPDQVQNVEVVATDGLGRTTVRTRTLRVDARAPVLTLPEAPAVVNWQNAEVQARVDEENPGVVRIDGVVVAAQADGSFARSVPLREERDYEIVVEAQDAVGNVARGSVRLRCDRTAPVLAWNEPAADTVPAGDVLVAGTVTDASGSEVRVNGGVAAQTDGAWSRTVQVPAGGTLEVRVTARDAAGNEGKPLTRTLRGVESVVTLPWADAAPDSKPVDVDGRKYPSIVVEKQTGMRMVLIPAGTFTMGSPDSEPERKSSEEQHRRVIRKPFWLGETEVTQAQWQQVMRINPSRFQGAGNPVENVSWNDCQQFVQNLNGRAGGGFRLPSEAEWEYACRAGTTTPFSFGTNITTRQVNYNGDFPYNGAARGENRQSTVPARSLPANPWGLYEMHGNVWEWCEDTVAAYPGTGTEEPTRGEGSRVLRGGSWLTGAWFCRSADRGGSDPGYRDDVVGFRLSRTL